MIHDGVWGLVLPVVVVVVVVIVIEAGVGVGVGRMLMTYRGTFQEAPIRYR